MSIKKIVLAVCSMSLLVFSVLFFRSSFSAMKSDNKLSVAAPTSLIQSPIPSISAIPAIEVTFVGPRQNIPKDAPSAYGFWSFAQAVPGVLSRSGQPLFSEFEWLKKNGWKGDVDLRTDGERGEVGDDSKIKGFNELGLNYLYLPIADGSAPTDAQAKQFLEFVTNPVNQPAHVHCRGGYGRSGTMVALYRYSVQNWPMEKAIEESRLFHGGVSEAQQKWLLSWAKNHVN